MWPTLYDHSIARRWIGVGRCRAPPRGYDANQIRASVPEIFAGTGCQAVQNDSQIVQLGSNPVHLLGWKRNMSRRMKGQMTEIDLAAMRNQVKASLEANRGDDGMNAMDVDDLMAAMSHPKAADVVQSLMALEPQVVEQDQPAPDFSLPWLSGRGPDGSTSVTLSSHFGKRPVALIFGSYT